MRPVVVFDFDKTLSYKDSLTEIFKNEMKGVKSPYRVFYFILQVLSKFKFTTSKTEKEIMIRLLFNSSETSFRCACENYAKCKDLNSIFKIFQGKINDSWRVIVLSASSQCFLESILKDYPTVEIIGTTFDVSNGIITGISRHPSGMGKYIQIKALELNNIDEYYYDSKSDEYLLSLSKVAYKIKNGSIIDKYEG